MRISITVVRTRTSARIGRPKVASTRYVTKSKPIIHSALAKDILGHR